MDLMMTMKWIKTAPWAVLIRSSLVIFGPYGPKIHVDSRRCFD